MCYYGYLYPLKNCSYILNWKRVRVSARALSVIRYWSYNYCFTRSHVSSDLNLCRNSKNSFRVPSSCRHRYYLVLKTLCPSGPFDNMYSNGEWWCMSYVQ